MYLYPEILEADAGWLNEGDADLSADLTEALNSAESSRRKAQSARQLVTDKFVWPVVSRKMLCLYQEILRAPLLNDERKP